MKKFIFGIILLGLILMCGFASSKIAYVEINRDYGVEVNLTNYYNKTDIDSFNYINQTTEGSNITINGTGQSRTIGINMTSLRAFFESIFVEISRITDYVGNWSLDKPNYYTNTQVDAINTSMKNYVDWVNSTSSFSESDPYWTANYTAFNETWSSTTNTSYIPYTGANNNLNIGSYNITANWFNGKFNWTTDTWNSFDGSTLTFNESKLSTTYYNATQVDSIKGTIAGTISLTQHSDGSYDGITLNVTEVAGSPGLDIRINFTGIDSFNQGIMRYKTSSLAGDYPIIQMWNYDTSSWEDYPAVATSLTFATIEQPVFDYSDHLQGGVAQMRIYKSSNGNTNNKYYIDWLAIAKGFGTPAGEEVDPYSIHRDGTVQLTGDWNAGSYNITTEANLIISNGTSTPHWNMYEDGNGTLVWEQL